MKNQELNLELVAQLKKAFELLQDHYNLGSKPSPADFKAIKEIQKTLAKTK